jgi:hypothetical protein
MASLHTTPIEDGDAMIIARFVEPAASHQRLP